MAEWKKVSFCPKISDFYSITHKTSRPAFQTITTAQLLSARLVESSCDIEDIRWMWFLPRKVRLTYTNSYTHTPIKSPDPKKLKKRGTSKDDGNISAAILQAVQALTEKVDEQRELLKQFNKHIEANVTATKENKQEISLLKKRIDELKWENGKPKNSTEEQARYKRRWNLRLIGLLEKDGENTREIVIGILTRIVPLSVYWLQDTVDTVPLQPG